MGFVVLSWDDILAAIAEPERAQNVIIHEFAHQLDMEDYRADCVPILPSRTMYRRWREVFAKEYLNLRRELASGEPDVIDFYGATDPGEFFAVATETFFGRPRELRLRHPELYQQLELFYGPPPEIRQTDAPFHRTTPK